MSRGDEIRSDTIKGEGTITASISPENYGRMLCWATHPVALELGRIAPGVPCCANCTLIKRATNG